MPNKQTQNLLQKFVNDQCTKEETEQLIAYFRSATDAESIPSVEEILNLIDAKPTMDVNTVNRIYNEIIKLGIQQKKEKNSLWRYAAAAVVVGLLASTYFLKDTIFNNQIENTTPIIVNNNIKTGTDKATLTLETGEQITLVKGASIQTQNASSNGEEIIYDNSPSNKLAYNYLTIPRGGQFQLTLADGTKVWLNSETKLKYPVAFNDGESRQVELVYGEAYFDVSPSTAHNGATFKVFNNTQEIEVLGTEFNIKAYKAAQTIHTTLVEGKVSITAGNQVQVLKPGERSDLDLVANTIQVNKADVFRETAWKQGVFSFKDLPLKEIMETLSRWYDMEIVFENPDLRNARFVGTFYKHQSIEEIMMNIKNTHVVKNYEIHNKTLLLK
jgi:hypothetical protein